MAINLSSLSAKLDFSGFFVICKKALILAFANMNLRLGINYPATVTGWMDSLFLQHSISQWMITPKKSQFKITTRLVGF